MNDKIIKISKKTVKGDDGYRTFSIRIKEETVDALDDLSIKSNRSRNDLINIILEFGVAHSVIDDDNYGKKGCFDPILK